MGRNGISERNGIRTAKKRAWDDVTGRELDWEGVVAARAE